MKAQNKNNKIKEWRSANRSFIVSQIHRQIREGNKGSVSQIQ
jgi:hypothetical protein